MILTGEILGDTSVVDNACDLAHIHSVRSIRSENIDGEFCAGLDGKPSDMNCSVMASKVGALAVGAKADNTSEANGLIPPDKFCDNPSCLAHSFLGKKEPPLRSLCRVLCGCGRRLAGVVLPMGD